MSHLAISSPTLSAILNRINLIKQVDSVHRIQYNELKFILLYLNSGSSKESNPVKDYFSRTSHQKILTFLGEYAERSFYEKEIREAAKLSAGAANKALRELARDGYLLKEKKGRMCFYSVDISNPLIQRFKVLLNILRLSPLLERLKGSSRRIVLFGSAAEGTNTSESDIDLFILTDEADNVTRILEKSDLTEKIQSVIKTPLQFVEMETKDKVFYEQVIRGITLWEQKDESRI